MGKSERATPFLRWAGSKRAAIPELRKSVPGTFSRYIEPFAGSACLFFDIAPERALLADLNAWLITTYSSVKNEPNRVAELLADLPFGKDAFYDLRSQDLKEKTRAYRAAMFIYLNRFCFNGLFRTNRKGRFNVPFGAPRNASVPDAAHLQLCSARLKNARLMNGDFESIVSKNVVRGDFVYLDPPFFQNEGRVFRQYNAKQFIRDDLARLSKTLQLIDRRGAYFTLSYAENLEGAMLSRSWNHRSISLQRNIAGFAGFRGKSVEGLITNH